jgi:phosphonate transport system substrate-binding protein
MKALVLTLLIITSQLIASQKLVFGAISTIEPHLMQVKLEPLMKEIEKACGKKLVFKTGYDYSDTINKFADGTFDIGLIGPAPYIKTQNINPNALIILAGIKNSNENPFRSVIVSKKGSKFKKYTDLKDTNFAFGSPNSTLSYYVPRYMLENSQTINKIKRYHFLGRHDRVAKYVIMGKFAAGAIKQSIANKYSKYLQVIATSEAIPGFMIVANKKLDKKLILKIQNLLLNFKNISAIKKIKKTATGFEARKDKDYDKLRKIMKEVDAYK